MRTKDILHLPAVAGLITIYGRLEKAPALLFDEKHPILLPYCHITYLVVKDQHELMKHAGVNTLITAVRGKYWILSLIAKKIFKVFINCQRQESRPCQQFLSPLPEDRIKKIPPPPFLSVELIMLDHCFAQTLGTENYTLHCLLG